MSDVMLDSCHGQRTGQRDTSPNTVGAAAHLRVNVDDLGRTFAWYASVTSRRRRRCMKACLHLCTGMLEWLFREL